MRWVYQFVLICAFFFYIPKLLWDYVVRAKYRGYLLKRLGLIFPKFCKDERDLIWVHAVSLGEFKAVSYLLQKWIREYPHLRFFVSHGTQTGYQEAQRIFGHSLEHAYLPIDFMPNVQRWFDLLNPKAMILVESDYWYNYLYEAKKRECYVAVINAKISPRSARRFRFFPFFARSLFSFVDRFCLKSEHELSSFKSLGICPQRLSVTGNIKWDHPTKGADPIKLESLKQQLKITNEHRVLVFASTHQGEEALLIHALKSVISAPEIKVLVVPRHPERFVRVHSMLKKYSKLGSVVALSQANSLSAQEIAKAKFLLIDQMGILNECYGLCSLALVGGTWVKVGGHNILEPLALYVPTFYGPYMFQQPEMHELAQKFQSAEQVCIENLQDSVLRVLRCTESTSQRIENIRKMLESFKGAVDRTHNIIFKDLKEYAPSLFTQ